MSQIYKTPKGTELPILDLRGKPYLQVAHRLVWFREEHPDWSIQTEFIEATLNQSFAKAIISAPSGQIMSTGHKFEDKQGFADHREKAETGAVGRALAMIGYGTQFCADELDEGSRIVDAPATRIVVGQPMAGDGRTPVVQPHATPAPAQGYRIPFGKYSRRGLHEVKPEDHSNYCDWLEAQAAKKGEPIREEVAQYIALAREYVRSHQPLEDAPF